MTSPALAPYHVREQETGALLAPVEASLAELEARLAHYVTRVRMTDDVRAAISRARSAVEQARVEVGQIVAGARPARA